jgi:hypothetical protein
MPGLPGPIWGGFGQSAHLACATTLATRTPLNLEPLNALNLRM